MKAGLIGACALLVILILLFSREGANSDTKEEAPQKEVPRILSVDPGDPVLSDTMLAGYAGDDTSGAEDLKMMGRFLDSVFLLVKQRDTADYSTNEDLVIFLHGNNSHHSSFLAKNGPAINDKGQLIDRWGSPLILHPVSQKLLELRSAGPDKKPYTEDDLLWPKQH